MFTILLIGDVVGESGLSILASSLSAVKSKYKANFTIVNGENAADGFGMTAASAAAIFAAGADIITSGNHIWEKRDFMSVLDSDSRILRPANYPPPAPGRGYVLIEKGGEKLLVINMQGREFMKPIDCPFMTFDKIYNECGGENSGVLTIVDFHAESEREKEALAFYVDGRALVLAGTHTHVQTADERLLPGGTAYITDIGMTGSTDSIIGMDKQVCIKRMQTHVQYKMECAKSAGSVQGIAVQVEGGKAESIERWTAP